jgi:hypothetical protein
MDHLKYTQDIYKRFLSFSVAICMDMMHSYFFVLNSYEY